MISKKFWCRITKRIDYKVILKIVYCYEMSLKIGEYSLRILLIWFQRNFDAALDFNQED